MLYNQNGAVVECVEGFPQRFDESYRLEAAEFIDCVQKNVQPGVKVYDGTRATQIAFATTQAHKTGELVKITY